MSRTIRDCQNDLGIMLHEANEMLVNHASMSEVSEQLKKLDDLKKEYAKRSFAQFCEDHPSIEDAIRSKFYEVVSIKDERDDNGIVERYKAVVNQTQFDLKSYISECKDKELRKRYSSAYSSILLVYKKVKLRIAYDIGMPFNALKELDDSFGLSRLITQFEEFEQSESTGTPNVISNTSIVGSMQIAANQLLGRCDFGKVLNCDMWYLMYQCLRKSRKMRYMTEFQSDKKFTELFVDVLDRILSHETWGVNFKSKMQSEMKITEKASEADKPKGKANKETKAEKSKAKAEPKPAKKPVKKATAAKRIAEHKTLMSEIAKAGDNK